MTSPNATKTRRMSVEVATVPDSMHVGLRQQWVEADNGDVQADLTTGAGLGSSYLALTVSRPGKETIRETIDVRDFLPGWINDAIERADAEPVETP